MPADGPTVKHRDYDMNLKQTEAWIEKGLSKWPKGLKILISGDAKQRQAIVIFSIQREELHSTTAFPLELHISNSIFKNRVQQTYRFYCQLANEAEQKIQSMPQIQNESHSGSLQSHNDPWSYEDTSGNPLSTYAKQMALANELIIPGQNLPRRADGSIPVEGELRRKR